MDNAKIEVGYALFHFAVAYESVSGIIFHLPYDIFRENIDAGHVQPLHKLKEVQNGNKTDM